MFDKVIDTIHFLKLFLNFITDTAECLIQYLCKLSCNKAYKNLYFMVILLTNLKVLLEILV